MHEQEATKGTEPEFWTTEETENTEWGLGLRQNHAGKIMGTGVGMTNGQ